MASLAGGDDVDATTVSFLPRKTLVLKEEKEERLEELLRELHVLRDAPMDRRTSQHTRRVHELLRLFGAASSSSSKKKRRRRKKKRRTPRGVFFVVHASVYGALGAHLLRFPRARAVRP